MRSVFNDEARNLLGKHMRVVKSLLLLAVGLFLAACQTDNVGPVLRIAQARLYVTGLTNGSEHLLLARIADFQYYSPSVYAGLDVAAFPPVQLQGGTNSTSFGTVTVICVVPEIFALRQSDLPVHLWLQGAVDDRPVSGEFRGPLKFTGETNVVERINARLEKSFEQHSLPPDLSDLPGTIMVPTAW